MSAKRLPPSSDFPFQRLSPSYSRHRPSSFIKVSPHHLLNRTSRARRSAMNSRKYNTCHSPHATAPPLQLPFTPPSSNEKQSDPVHRILKLFELRRKGKLVTKPWVKIRLSLEGYQDLLQQLEKDEDLKGYVEDKIRYDFDPVSCYLTVRIPTTLHERFIHGVSDEIQSQLYHPNVATSPSIATILQSIRGSGSGDIFLLPNDSAKRSPDASFQRKDVQYPSVVMEVSYSQKRKDLPKIAQSYILDSLHGIKMVVGLDVEYRKKEAVVFVWRAGIEKGEDGIDEGICETVIDAAPFRTAEGEAVSTGDLTFRLKDFLLRKTIEQIPEADPEAIIVSIPLKNLADLLCDAEETYKSSKPGAGDRDEAPVRMGKKRDASSSPEPVSEEEDETMEDNSSDDSEWLP